MCALPVSQAHAWFKEIDWRYLREAPGPFVPQLNHAEDTDYFKNERQDEIARVASLLGTNLEAQIGAARLPARVRPPAHRRCAPFPPSGTIEAEEGMDDDPYAARANARKDGENIPHLNLVEGGEGPRRSSVMGFEEDEANAFIDKYLKEEGGDSDEEDEAFTASKIDREG